MKRMIAIVLVVAISCSTISFPAFASEVQDDATAENYRTGAEVLDLASEIWPEYEEKLRSDSTTMNLARSGGVDEVVVQESHQLSENETITYVEYASGFALAALVKNWYEESATPGLAGNSMVYVGNLTVASGISVSYLIGFKYVIYNGTNNDRISNYGTFSNCFAEVHEHGRQTFEVSSLNPAYYTYMVYFYNTDGALRGQARAHIEVGNNEFYWEVAG